jgi:hypothetical protein
MNYRFSICLTSECQLPFGEQIVELHGTPQWLDEISAFSRASNLREFGVYGVRKDVSDILMEIGYLSRYFSSQSNGKGVSWSSANSSGKSIHCITASILGRLLQLNLDQDLEGLSTPIDNCCRWAASIFIFLPFDNHFPDPTLVLNSLVHRLQTSLNYIAPRTLEGTKLLAWILSVGGIASANLPTERDWFVSQLAETTVELGVKTWDDMEKSLKNVVWIDGIDESPFRQLWEEALIRITCPTLQDPFGAIRYNLRPTAWEDLI